MRNGLFEEVLELDEMVIGMMWFGEGCKEDRFGGERMLRERWMERGGEGVE